MLLSIVAVTLRQARLVPEWVTGHSDLLSLSHPSVSSQMITQRNYPAKAGEVNRHIA